MRIRIPFLLFLLGACTPQPLPEPDPVPVPEQPTVPGAPTAVVALRGRGQAELTWVAPDDGRSPLLRYTVTSSPEGVTANANSTRAIVPGLTNGTSYTFIVTATNAVGNGLASAPSNAVTPATVPTAPASVLAIAGNQQATVSWTRPADVGGSELTGYLVRFANGDMAAVTQGATQAVITGLVNGSTHAFTVTAANEVGSSPPSGFSNTVTPLAVPGSPEGVSAIAGDASAVLRWSAPVDQGGSPVNLYTVTSTPGGRSATTTGATEVTVSGLLNGTLYSFTVTANNTVGRGPASAPSNAVTPATLPGPPVNVTAVSDNQAALITWGAPFNDGGGSITGYTVTSIPEGLTAFTSGSRAAVVLGLTNGRPYTFTVRASNWAGAGLPSLPSNAATPLGAPWAPTAVTAARGNASATVSWTAPVDTGGTPVTSYVVTQSPGSASVTTSGTASQTVVSGLTNGTSYTFTVTAVNVIGPGGASDPSNVVIPSTVPGAPSSLVVIAGDREVDVSWNAPADNGAPITQYAVTSSPGGIITSTTGATNVRVSGLTNGVPYTFRVVATNLVGPGPASVPSTPIVPAAIPGAPTNVIAVPQNRQASISWQSAPNNGSPIRQYEVTSNPGGVVLTSLGTSLVFTGLTNGTTYSFTVLATNAMGPGPMSLPSNTVTPATVPSAPSGVTAIGGTGPTSLSWSAPTSDGSSPITGYVVTLLPAGTTFLFGPVTQATITGLLYGSSYSFTVAAINALGRGAPSAPSNVISVGTPACDGAVIMGGQLPQVSTILVPSSVRLTDLDADGALDMLVADTTGDSLTVHRGRGNGAFYPAIIFPLMPSSGGSDRFIAVGDFNADGRPDVAVSGVTSPSVSVLLGDAANLLSPRIDSPLASGASLTVGDFDGDGRSDMFAGLVTGNVVFLRGAGTGTFSQPASPTTGGRWITSGDFDGDARLDIAASTGSVVRVMLGSGNGTLQAVTTVPLPGSGVPALLDVNSDGRLDLAVTNGSAVSVALGQGTGTFGAPTNYSTGMSGAGFMASGDLNADGLVDLVTANSAGVSVLLGTISGGFVLAPAVAIPSGPRAMALGDLTGDGKVDLMVASPSMLTPLAGRGDGAFSAPTTRTFSVGTTPFFIASGDFNADGKLDLVSANSASNSLSVALGIGDGSFLAPTLYGAGGLALSVLSVDLDADGALDLITANRSDNTITVRRGTGSGTFPTAVTIPVPWGPSHVVAADFNGDGLKDLVTANIGADSVTILKGNGAGGFQPAVSFAAFGGPHALAVADYDSDGNLDLAVALFNSNRVGVLLGNGNGTFRTPVTYLVGTNPRSIVAGDFDGDGRPDLAVGHFIGTYMSVLRGAGSGTFAPQAAYLLGSQQVSIFSSDIDADGKLDLLTTNGDGRLSLFRGKGDATFLSPVSYTVAASPYGGIVGDFNGDGSADFAVASSSRNEVSVLLRTTCTP